MGFGMLTKYACMRSYTSCLNHDQNKKLWVLIASSLLGSTFAVGKETLA